MCDSLSLFSTEEAEKAANSSSTSVTNDPGEDSALTHPAPMKSSPHPPSATLHERRDPAPRRREWGPSTCGTNQLTPNADEMLDLPRFAPRRASANAGDGDERQHRPGGVALSAFTVPPPSDPNDRRAFSLESETMTTTGSEDARGSVSRPTAVSAPPALVVSTHAMRPWRPSDDGLDAESFASDITMRTAASSMTTSGAFSGPVGAPAACAVYVVNAPQDTTAGGSSNDNNSTGLNSNQNFQQQQQQHYQSGSDTSSDDTLLPMMTANIPLPFALLPIPRRGRAMQVAEGTPLSRDASPASSPAQHQQQQRAHRDSEGKPALTLSSSSASGVFSSNNNNNNNNNLVRDSGSSSLPVFAAFPLVQTAHLQGGGSAGSSATSTTEWQKRHS